MKKRKQIAAWIGIILLVAMYVVTLVMAVVDKSSSGSWFMASLAMTMVIPVLLWFYIWLYGRMTGKKTIADSGWSEDNEVIDTTDNHLSGEGEDETI